MTLVRKVLGITMCGVLVGATMGMVAPFRALASEEGCKCDDLDKGAYRCTADQTGCEAGVEKCFVVCTEVN